MEICTSHFKEDLSWIPHEYKLTIVGHEGEDPIKLERQYDHYIIPNKGNEASSYLFFIIRRYDTLPEYTVFIHGHETSWHQKSQRPLGDLIRTANIKDHKFIPLNNYYRLLQITGTTKEYNDFFNGFKTIMSILPPEFYPPMDLYAPVCAQFIVHKDLILRHPKEIYMNLFHILNTSEDPTMLGVCMEFLFIKIFMNTYWLYDNQTYFQPSIEPMFLEVQDV